MRLEDARCSVATILCLMSFVLCFLVLFCRHRLIIARHPTSASTHHYIFYPSKTNFELQTLNFISERESDPIGGVEVVEWLFSTTQVSVTYVQKPFSSESGTPAKNSTPADFSSTTNLSTFPL